MDKDIYFQLLREIYSKLINDHKFFKKISLDTVQ